MNKLIGTIGLGIVAIVATVYSGVIHGRIRHTSGFGMDLSAEIVAVEGLPAEIVSNETGAVAWERVDQPIDLDPEVVELLECRGYYQASYKSTTSEIYVSALVLLGPSGPISLHEAETCYPSQGFRLRGKRDRRKISPKNGARGELWVADFDSPDVDRRLVRVAYGWTIDGQWEASSNARREFAGKPFLYKIQLYAGLPPYYDFEAQGDPVTAFATDFFPVLEKQLFSD